VAGDRTFAQLEARTNQLARALRRGGLQAGDSVAIALTNRPEYAEAVHACLRSGLRYTPVNWQLTPDEIVYIVNDCEARAVVGDAHAATTLAAVAEASPKVDCFLSVGGSIAGFSSYDAAVEAEDDTLIDEPVLGSRMLYTSGTTGRPKGVVRPPSYSTGLTALTTAPKYAAGTGQRNLCTGPLYHGGPHGYGMTVPLANGVGIVLMERWDAATALTLIEQHHITHTHMVPTMFHRLLRLPDEVRSLADVTSLQYVLHGAAPCPVDTKQAIIDWFGPIVWEYFAATEGAGASCSSEEWLARPGTVGRPPTPDHIRILDDDCRDQPAGRAGEICFKRDESVTFEYFKDPAKTAEAIRTPGYASVGDIGYLDDDGWLFITDRTAEIIVRGGVNIYPVEVETVLLAHPAVRDAAVIGVADDEWGEIVVGVVELDDSATEEAMLAWCRERLARFKCPAKIDIVDSLPRFDNGKLYRHRLRQEYRSAISNEGET
jgi:long-chain acyl-CoA synthetase